MKENQKAQPPVMETNDGGIKTSYEEFEPYCKWQREEDCDSLELHLQDYKKEQLKVQLKDAILVITGERPINNNLRSRFRKEIKVSKHCKASEIRAKFSNRGILTISLPKITTPSPAAQNLSTLSADLPSIYRPKLNAKLAVQVAVVVALAIAFGAFVYNYYCYVRTC